MTTYTDGDGIFRIGLKETDGFYHFKVSTNKTSHRIYKGRLEKTVSSSPGYVVIRFLKDGTIRLMTDDAVDVVLPEE